jgi:hypothetical protein
VPTFETASNAFATDTVCVPAAELHDLYAGVDSLLLERRLLQIDLWETRRGAHVDSVLFADRLALRDAQQDSWFIRALKHPAMDALYFILGVYVGARAIQEVK